MEGCSLRAPPAPPPTTEQESSRPQKASMDKPASLQPSVTMQILPHDWAGGRAGPGDPRSVSAPRQQAVRPVVGGTAPPGEALVPFSVLSSEGVGRSPTSGQRNHPADYSRNW